MASVRGALGELIRAHDPYPAVVVDRGWDVVMANTGAQGVPRRRRRAPARAAAERRTASRCTPTGWRRGSTTSTSGPTTCSARSTARSRPPATRACATLLDEVSSYPNVAALGGVVADPRRDIPTIVVPLRLRVGDGDDAYVQSWFSTNTSIGTPVDITLDELHVELFHPADEATAALVGGRTA